MPQNYTPAEYRSEDYDVDTLGPAMKALNLRQRAFVDFVVTEGCTRGDFTKAAKAAGYGSDSYGALRVTAYRLSHDEKIIAAIREECERRYQGELPMSLKTISQIAANPEHKDALKAAQLIASFSGVSPIAKSEKRIVHTTSLLEDARAAADVLGLDLGELMRGRVKRQDVIDLTPERVTDDE